MAKANLTAKQLRELLHYDPETGIFTWLVRRGCALAGDVAGNLTKAGYIQIYVNNIQYKAHRLAWLYVYESFPEKFIDHINGKRSDNKIVNLRNVTNAENVQNLRHARSDNGSGLQGVGKNGRGKKWRATITILGKKKFLGNFHTKELAHQAYLEAKRILHPTCTI